MNLIVTLKTNKKTAYLFNKLLSTGFGKDPVFSCIKLLQTSLEINSLEVNCFYVCFYALQLPCYSFSSLVKTFQEYRGIWSKKYFTDYRTANIMQLVVAIKGGSFWSILSLNKSRQREIP